tara:strand:+ start:935 stop:1441 length:507 start_codon:yes stop_codon:yes gene_type:complete
MPYKFKCRKCNNFIYIPEILDRKVTYYCKSCNIDNTFNKRQAYKFFNIKEITQKEFESTESTESTESPESPESPENIDNEKNNKNNLSQKYDILESYKGLAFLLMIASTGFFIYTIVQFVDAPKMARKILENTMIASTVSYIITMFSLFCLTKMIDFLFDLDKHKSDK